MGMTRTYTIDEPSRDVVDSLPGPMVLEFGAPWCGHCTAARPLVEAAFAAHPDVRHIKVEDGPGRPLGRSYRIKLWPTFVFLRDGVERARLVRPTDGAAMIEAMAGIDPH